MTFVKKQLTPFSSAAADPLFNFSQPFIQQGVISGRYYSADEVAYGNPKPGYLEPSANSNVVTVVASSAIPLRLVFALGLHDANTGGEVGSWRTFTGKTSSNVNVTVSSSEKGWIYAEINENGQPNNPGAWTITYANEPAKDRTYSSQVDEPVAPVDGNVWFNPITNLLKKYNGDTSQWDTKKRVYLGEAGIGNNGYVYTVQSWYPELGYAQYQDSFYEPYYENPWRHYDGVSFLTNGQYTAMEAANWANNFTIAQAVAGNQIAMNAVANSATAVNTTAISANSFNAFGNSSLAITSLGANVTSTGVYANSTVSMNSFANNSNAMSSIANTPGFMISIANSSVAMTLIANSSIAMAPIANSSVAMTSIATSSVAMTLIANSSIAMAPIANSAIAMAPIANSAIAQGRIVTGSQISTFRNTVANNSTILTILKNGSAGNILFDLISTNSSYQTLVANAQGQLVALANSISGPILALGGNTVTEITDGGINYRVHRFTGSGTLNVRSVGEQANVQYVVVAGGGGGAGNRGGGGGAGGYRTNVPGQSSGGSPGTSEPALSVAQSTSYTITVGAGGVSAINPLSGQKGSSSSFGPLISTVGGGGGISRQVTPSANRSAATGGSGGGGASHDNDPITTDTDITGYSGTPGQGNAGGNAIAPGVGSNAGTGGGGGGSGGVGGNATGTSGNTATQIGGTGGTGRNSPITGTSIMYAGGGGGAGNAGGAGAAGGHPVISGAGYGKVYAGVSLFPGPTFSSYGLANRGGGGGGGNDATPGAEPSNNTNFAGHGGSGVVIIRYPIQKV